MFYIFIGEPMSFDFSRKSLHGSMNSMSSHQFSSDLGFSFTASTVSSGSQQMLDKKLLFFPKLTYL